MSRRSLGWMLLTLVVAGGLAAGAGVRVWQASDYRPVDPAAAREASAGRRVPLDPKVKQVVSAFLWAAVGRHDPVAAYNLSGPAIRQGETLAEWTRDWRDPKVGVPIHPWPVEKAWATPLRVDDSRERSALVELALLPKQRGDLKGQVFVVRVSKFKHGGDTRWLVDSWAPLHAPPSAPP